MFYLREITYGSSLVFLNDMLMFYQVIAGVRDPSKIPESIKDAKPLIIDMGASDTDIKRAGQEALKIYGKIDVLVNNAGGYHHSRPWYFFLLSY